MVPQHDAEYNIFIFVAMRIGCKASRQWRRTRGQQLHEDRGIARRGRHRTMQPTEFDRRFTAEIPVSPWMLSRK
jgi:hypothetical protein